LHDSWPLQMQPPFGQWLAAYEHFFFQTQNPQHERSE
jgi:hypothetical protein